MSAATRDVLRVVHRDLVNSHDDLIDIFDDPDDLSDLLITARRARATLLVAPVARLTDDILTNLLSSLAEELDGDRPWQEVGQIGLVTGRDRAALERFYARINKPHRRHGSAVLRLDNPGQDATWRSERRFGDGSETGSRGQVSGSTMLDDVEPISVLAVQAHGSEACAKGSDGLVYCGRVAGDVPMIEGDGGFACGRGHACPRGPRPRSVAPMADVLMMAVCGGLRLGDSINHDAFSFALNFIDGPGRAFVSSITSNSGAPLAATAFMATIADGHTVGAATVMANALPMLAGIDDPTYLLIGDPDYRPVTEVLPSDAQCLKALPSVFDAGRLHHLVLRIPAGDESAGSAGSSLTVSAQSTTAPEVIGCVRRIAADGTGAVAHEIHLLAFPEPLGVLTLDAFAPAALENRLRAALAMTERWLARWRILGLADQESEDFATFVELRDEISVRIAKAVPLLALSGTLAAGATALASYAEAIVGTIAAQTLALLSPQLSTSFWLSNALAAHYRFEGSQSGECPTCAAPARERTVRNGVGDDIRGVLVCHRCGIGLDRDLSGSITRIGIEVLGSARAGEALRLRLLIDAAYATTASLAVRLTMPGQESPEPDEAPDAVMLQSGRNAIDIVFRLPDATAPHRYYIKVLAAVADDLVFACRPFFVLPPALH